MAKKPELSLTDRLRKLEEDTGFLISGYVAGFDADSWGRVIAIVERAEMAKERALMTERDDFTRHRWKEAAEGYDESKPGGPRGRRRQRKG